MLPTRPTFRSAAPINDLAVGSSGFEHVSAEYQLNRVAGLSFHLIFLLTMPTKEREDLLTEDQKATLIPHVNAFRDGHRTQRSQIVTKLAKTMYSEDDLPAHQSRYFKVIQFVMNVVLNVCSWIFLGCQKLVLQPR